MTDLPPEDERNPPPTANERALRFRLAEIDRLWTNAAPAVRRALDQEKIAIAKQLRNEMVERRRSYDEWMLKEVATLRAADNAQRRRARYFRILCGTALGAAAWWVYSIGPDITSKPLASLTLGEIGGALLSTVWALGLVAWAFEVAFGEASNPPSDSSLRDLAKQKLSSQ